MAFNISYVYHAIDKFTPIAGKIKRSVGNIKREFIKANFSAKKLGESLKNLTRKAAITATLVGGLAVRSFARFETALLGVAKTANIAVGPELDAFGNKFTELSLKIPVSAVELLNFGQAAAQLGVEGKKNILNFAQVMAKLTKTTNIMGEEGASQLARLIKVTGGNVAQVENYASALVALGNTSAATEAEILSFATRLGASGALFGITGIQALGLATTLKSVGIQAEEGGSSIARGLGAINKTILEGGSKLKDLSTLTGIAAKDLKAAFGKDAIGVLTKFSLGLDKFITKGGDATTALAHFGLEGIRDLRTIGSLAKNTDLLTEKLAQAGDAFKKNTALEKEFAVQSQSLSNDFKILTNNLSKMGKLITLNIKPVLDATIGNLVKGIQTINTILGDRLSLGKGEEVRQKIAMEIEKMSSKSLTTINQKSSSIELNGSIDINAPVGVVGSVGSTVKGASGNLGVSMAGAG